MAISKDSEPENIGGEKEGNNTQERTTTTTTTQKQETFPEQAEPKQHRGETSEEYEQIESVKEFNDHLSKTDEAGGIGGSCVKGIIEHDWKLG